MVLSPSEGGGPLFTYYSVLVREEATIHIYSVQPTILILPSSSQGGGILFTYYSVLVREEAHYSHATQS